jgi:hypothetical protein
LFKNASSNKNSLITIVEISEPKTTKEGDQAKQKFFAVKSQPKRAADNPRISQSLLQEGEDAWRQVRIGMQEKQDLTSRLARPGIHLDGTTPLAVDHPGMWPDGLNRPIYTAAVNDNELKLALLVSDTMQAREDSSGLVQSWNNHRNFHV